MTPLPAENGPTKPPKSGNMKPPLWKRIWLSVLPHRTKRLFPSGNCPGIANDGTHAVDGDGWPE